MIGEIWDGAWRTVVLVAAFMLLVLAAGALLHLLIFLGVGGLYLIFFGGLWLSDRDHKRFEKQRELEERRRAEAEAGKRLEMRGK